MREIVSVHSITNAENIPFDPYSYSKFKYGCKDVAKQYGLQLALQVYRKLNFLCLPKDTQIVVISSPYCFIPTATFAMKDYLVKHLNSLLIIDDYPVVEETKIHRTITYKDDYGALNAEERLKLISNDNFHIDKEFIKGKFLIFLDDIRITGSHERVIDWMLKKYGIDNDCIFAYYATLDNTSIDPTIENYLNYYAVKELLDVDKIIKNDSFLFNTRVVKYILCAPPEQAKPFLQYQSSKFLETLYHLAIGNSYHKIPEYQENLELVNSLIL